MAVLTGEAAGGGEISISALVASFQAERENDDHTERDKLGRKIMGFVLGEIKLTGLAEWLIFQPNGSNYLVDDKQSKRPAKLEDYLAVAIDYDHHGADSLILNYAGMAPEHQDYTELGGAIRDYIIEFKTGGFLRES